MTMNNGKTARVVGALFLIAMATSLIGAGLIETVLSAPDYLNGISASETQLRLGVLLEMINGIAVVGIAVLMFPIFRKLDEALALGYVAFRIIEGVIIFAALISPLTLIALSQDFSTAGTAEAITFDTLGSSYMAVRGHLIGEMLGIFFSMAALIFYTLLLRSSLVPRWLSIWGLVAVVLLFVWNFLELLGVSIDAGIVLGLPIILNEIILGFWLIIKGFDSTAIESEPVRTAVDAV